MGYSPWGHRVDTAEGLCGHVFTMQPAVLVGT